MLMPQLAFWAPPSLSFQGILDLYPGAEGAWSLRQLSSSTTNVVRVRRDSDDTEDDFTADDVSGGALETWVGGANDGFVVTLYDQGGNSYDLTQSTQADQPQIVSAGALVTDNGKPAMDFASGKYLENAAVDFSFTGNAINVFSVASQVQDASLRWLVRYGAVFNIRANTTPYFVAAQTGGDLYLSKVYSLDRADQTIMSSLFDGDTGLLQVYENNVQAVSDGTLEILGGGVDWDAGDTISDGGALGLSLGARDDGTQSWDGVIQEFILWTDDQSTNRESIEENIGNHYEIYRVENQALSDRFIQGVAVSGTDAWVTSTPTASSGIALRKYDTTDWSVVATATQDDVMDTLSFSSLGDCFLDGGVLYIAGGASYVMEIDPDTLAHENIIDLTATTTNYLNGITKKDGIWYIGETNTDSNPRRILKFDESWSYLGIAWQSTAPDGEDIVQGMDFVGNYLFVGLHTPLITVFELDGSNELSVVDTISVDVDDVQGFSYANGNLYYANRTPNVSTGSRVSWIKDFVYYGA